jgi:type II secretory pathway pseudopilin PulG
MLDELGLGARIDSDTVHFVLGVRTAWSNPDDVVAKLVAIPPDDLANGHAAEHGKAIADAAPNAPFARDFAAGYGGLMVPAALVGMLSAVAIPAFLDYMKKSKQSEATLELNALGKRLRVYAAEHGGFPKGDAGPTPNFPTCCGLSSTGGAVDNRCPTAPSIWSTAKLWSVLDFSIDGPTSYRYSYHSDDGKTFDAKAIGDLDCDGNVAIYGLHGAMNGDQPELTLEKPEPGVY